MGTPKNDEDKAQLPAEANADARPKTPEPSAEASLDKLQASLGDGVGRLGHGIEVLGDTVASLAHRVEHVPLVGPGVKEFGEGITELGEGLQTIPAVARSATGRKIFRSMLLSFLLIFGWISGIVWLQLRLSSTLDFRPYAERVLSAISRGEHAALYERASPRLQERTRESQFMDEMSDLSRTLGRYIEIVAIHETETRTGPSGQVARVELLLRFEKAETTGQLSFHYVQGAWRLLGIAVTVPPSLPVSQEQKAERSRTPPEIKGLAESILAQTAKGRDQDLWTQATENFRTNIGLNEFVQLQQLRRKVLGNYVRILSVTDTATLGPEKLGAAFVGIVEFERGTAATTISFARKLIDTPWQMTALKIVLPVADEAEAFTPPGVKSAPLPAVPAGEPPPGASGN